MIKQPHVFIITISHNGHNDTIEFLESLKSLLYRSYSVFIVDNSTNPASPEAIRSYITKEGTGAYITTENCIDLARLSQSSLTLITAANRGFASANNLVLKQLIIADAVTESNYVWIINNDVLVDRSSLGTLVETYERKLIENIGIVAPVIYYHGTNKIWMAGGHYFRHLGMMISFSKNKETINKKPARINFLSGCAWLIRIDRLKMIGLLDETYFMYGEDLDYSLKVCEKHLELYVEQDARIWHKIGNSSNGSFSSFSAYWMMFGRMRNILKHNTTLGKITGISVVFISRAFAFPMYLLKNRGHLITTQLKAIKNSLFAK